MPSDTCNRIRVERFFLEEAGAEEKRDTVAHLESCPRCKDQLDALTRERNGYLAVHPYTSFAAKRLERPAASMPRPLARPRWLPMVAGGLALLALAAVIRGPGLLDLQGGSAHPADGKGGDAAIGDGVAGISYKGGETLEFHYLRDGELKQGRLEEEYRAGDELQFQYASGKLSHVALLSVDASGTVSLYRKGGTGPASLPAKPGKVEPFPFGVTLDDAQGGELFVALFTQGPVSDADAEAWLAAAYGKSAGDLAALEKALRPPAAAASGTLKTLLLRKASP